MLFKVIRICNMARKSFLIFVYVFLCMCLLKPSEDAMIRIMKMTFHNLLPYWNLGVRSLLSLHHCEVSLHGFHLVLLCDLHTWFDSRDSVHTVVMQVKLIEISVYKISCIFSVLLLGSWFPGLANVHNAKLLTI